VEKIRAAATMVGDGDGHWMLLQRICVFFFYSGVPSQGVVCNRTVLIKFNPFLKKKNCSSVFLSHKSANSTFSRLFLTQANKLIISILVIIHVAVDGGSSYTRL
jgi:hypothetical protein